MKPQRAGLLFLGMVFIVGIFPGSAWAADLATRVARTMREYQGRYIYIHFTCLGAEPDENDYLIWPAPCNCTALRVPFPPNSYYKYSVGDPNCPGDPNAVELVQDILDKFWDEAVIYSSFLHKYWDPNELAYDPNYYSASDFPGLPQEVTTADYNSVLDELYDIITDKFIYLVKTCDACDPNIRAGNDICDGASCAEVKSEAHDDWVEDTWRDLPQAPADYTTRMYEETEKQDTGKYAYHAYKCALRRRIHCNLIHHNGTAKSYVKITRYVNVPTLYPEPWEYEEWSNMESGWSTPPSDANNWWEPWVTVSTGTSWTSGYLANFEPDFTSNCPEEISRRGWRYASSIVRVKPVFDTDPSGWSTDGAATKKVYKNNSTVYAANTDCDDSTHGEVVDGNVIPAQDVNCVMVRLLADYNDKAGELFVNGWDASGQSLTDSNKIMCVSCGDISSLPFSVKGHVMNPGANTVDVKFKTIFLRKDDANNIRWSEKDVTMNVKPNQGDICCREDVCVLLRVTLRNAEELLFCAYRNDAKVWEHDNDDIEALLPDRRGETYIMKTPACGFLEGWGVKKDGSDIVVTYGAGGVSYEFQTSSPYKLTSIKDLQGNTLVTLEYDEYNRLIKQKDASDPDYYIAYDYNDLGDFNDSPETIVLQADDVNRVYTVEYDGTGRAVAVTNGSCGCSGDGGSVRYVFDGNDQIKQERTYDTNEVIYEYVRDSQGNILEKWLGAKDANDCIQKTFSTETGGTTIVDIYDYVDANSYRVTREYRNGAGHVTKRIRYENLNEDPNDPEGMTFTEHTFYYYDANNIMIKNVVIPPKCDANDPDSGTRKEYTYDPNTGAILTEKWFDANDVNFTVASYIYEYIKDGNDIVNTRILTSTDIREAVAQYYYDGNSVDPNLKIMPEVSTGVSGTLQLKYAYEYDPNRGWMTLEKQLDKSDSVIVQTKYEYDDYSNLVKRYDDYQGSNEEVTEYEYNAFNERIQANLPSGVIQGWSYDDGGRLEYEVTYDPCDTGYVYSQTTYTYDGDGRLVKTAKAKDPNTFVIDSPEDDWVYTEYEYDLRGNRTKAIEDVNGLDLEITYSYNNQGEETKVTLPSGKWTKTYRDGRGLVIKTEVGYGGTTVATTTFEYDANGNLIRQTAPNGIKTEYEYDDFDRSIKIRQGL